MLAEIMGTKMTNILLTNDDGIESYGLWAAADSLSALGEVTVVAPSAQWSGAGRSLPRHASGMLRKFQHWIGERSFTAYAVDGSPAQAVQYGLLEIMPQPPDLVVAGINYGENLGTGITVSGTVGAALEAASNGIPAMAISLETPIADHLTNSSAIDFSVAAYFGCVFAEKLLHGDFRMTDIDAIKVDVPMGATRDTPWKITRVSRQQYYIPARPRRDNHTQHATIPFTLFWDASVEQDSDLYALHVEKKISLTPLSLDLTSRLDLLALDRTLRETTESHSCSGPAKPSR
jgi:5'-nucleotidase